MCSNKWECITDRRRIIALLKYFKKESVLPNPEGPLSDRLPSSSIAFANKEVKPLLEAKSKSKKRAQYDSYSAEEKAKVAKRASEMGVSRTLRFFSKDFADRPLKECTVRTWVSLYRKELASRSKFGKDTDIRELPSKRRGHPLLLDRQLQVYVKGLREAGAVKLCNSPSCC